MAISKYLTQWLKTKSGLMKECWVCNGHEA